MGTSAWRRPCRLARLQQRRLNLGRTPPECAPDPTRASPGRDEAVPSPESLGFGQATPMQSGAPLAAQAEPGPDPTRVGSQPGEGPRPPLHSRGRGRRRLCRMARLRLRRLTIGRTPPEWAPGLPQASPGRERLHPLLSRSASTWQRPCRLARLRPRRLNRGRTPPEWAPSQTRASPGGEGQRPPLSRSALARRRFRRGLGRCRVRHGVRYRGRSRPRRAPGLACAQGPGCSPAP